MIGLRVTGDDATGLAEELARELRPRMANAVLAGALMVEGAIKEQLSTPGRGIVYRRGTVLHRASALGDSPALDTGRLRGSFTHSGPTWTGPDEVEAETGTKNEYAAVHEFEGRPYIRPALERIEPAVDAMLERML